MTEQTVRALLQWANQPSTPPADAAMVRAALRADGRDPDTGKRR